MSAVVIPLRSTPHRPHGGTVCVMGDRATGFQVAHESSSGNSWGSFSDHPTGQEAIIAAVILNRDVYHGGCDLSVCPAALQDRDAGPAPFNQGDF